MDLTITLGGAVSGLAGASLIGWAFNQVWGYCAGKVRKLDMHVSDDLVIHTKLTTQVDAMASTVGRVEEKLDRVLEGR